MNRILIETEGLSRALTPSELVCDLTVRIEHVAYVCGHQADLVQLAIATWLLDHNLQIVEKK